MTPEPDDASDTADEDAVEGLPPDDEDVVIRADAIRELVRGCARWVRLFPSGEEEQMRPAARWAFGVDISYATIEHPSGEEPKTEDVVLLIHPRLGVVGIVMADGRSYGLTPL